MDEWNYNEKKNCDDETVTPINLHTTVYCNSIIFQCIDDILQTQLPTKKPITT